jgi:aminoglycoside 6'-N-acetyltransferase I
MKIIDLDHNHRDLIQQAAQLLVAAFRAHWPDAWPTLEDGLKEVDEMLEPGRICRAAVDESGDLLGVIGGIPGYDGNVWELHPLEVQVRARDGLTMTLGTDDEDNMTSLAEANLYENLWEKIRDIQDRKGHPFGFYQKMGYIISGVVPDANGRGKPDILMAKKL